MDNVPYGDIRFELRSGDYQLTIIPECAYISHKRNARMITHEELLIMLWETDLNV